MLLTVHLSYYLKCYQPENYSILIDTVYQTVSGQRLEWTKVRTGENTHGASNFNEIKNQCEHPIEGSDQ